MELTNNSKLITGDLSPVILVSCSMNGGYGGYLFRVRYPIHFQTKPAVLQPGIDGVGLFCLIWVVTTGVPWAIKMKHTTLFYGSSTKKVPQMASSCFIMFHPFFYGG